MAIFFGSRVTKDLKELEATADIIVACDRFLAVLGK